MLNSYDNRMTFETFKCDWDDSVQDKWDLWVLLSIIQNCVNVIMILPHLVVNIIIVVYGIRGLFSYYPTFFAVNCSVLFVYRQLVRSQQFLYC